MANYWNPLGTDEVPLVDDDEKMTEKEEGSANDKEKTEKEKKEKEREKEKQEKKHFEDLEDEGADQAVNEEQDEFSREIQRLRFEEEQKKAEIEGEAGAKNKAEDAEKDLLTQRKIELENEKRKLIAMRKESEDRYRKTSSVDEGYTTTFYVGVPENVCGYSFAKVDNFGFLCVAFRFPNQKEERVERMEPIGPNTYRAVVTFPKEAYEAAPQKCFSYYYVAYPHSKHQQRKLEDGNYRPIKVHKEEVWDIWCHRRYRMMGGFGAKDEECPEAFDEFVDNVLLSPISGPSTSYDDFFAFFNRYESLYDSLNAADQLYRAGVEEWAQNQLASLEPETRFLDLLSLIIILGSSKDLRVKQVASSGWGAGGYSNYSSYYSTPSSNTRSNNNNNNKSGGSFWPFSSGGGDDKPKFLKYADVSVKRLVEEANWLEIAQMIVQSVPRKGYGWLCKGTKILLGDDHINNRSYRWIGLFGMIGMLSELSSVYSSYFHAIDPPVREDGNASANFVEYLTFIEKEDLLLSSSVFNTGLLPLPKLLVDQAPSLASVVKVAESHQGLLLKSADFYPAFVELLQSKVRYYEFPRSSKEQKDDWKNLLVILRCLAPVDVSKVIKALCDNRYFADYVPPSRCIAPVELTISALAGNADELNSVGSALQGFLVRAYMSSQGRVLSHLVGHMIRTWNKLFSSQTMSKVYFGQLKSSLAQLLSGCSDTAVLIDELPKLADTDFHPVVYELFEIRATKAVAYFTRTEKDQVKVFNVLTNLKERDTVRLGALKNSLLFTLLQSVGGDSPSIQVLLHSAAVMKRIFKYSNSFKSSKAESAALLKEYCERTKDFLLSIRGNLTSGNVSLGEFSLICDNERAFCELLDSSGIGSISTKKLKAQREEVEEFDAKVSKLQTFVTIYCHPLNIDCGSLPDDLLGVRRDWNSLLLKDLSGLFVDLSVLPSLDYLYDLRTSDIFQALWKRTGEFTSAHGKHCVHLVDLSCVGLWRSDLNPVAKVALRLLDQKYRSGSSSSSLSGIPVPPPPPPPPVGVPLRFSALRSSNERSSSEEEDEENMLLGSFFMEEEKQAPVSMGPLLLTIDDAVEYLLPLVESEFKHFFRFVDLCTIEFPELEQTFGTLTSDKKVEHETKLLSQMGPQVYSEDSENQKKQKSGDQKSGDILEGFLKKHEIQKKELDELLGLDQKKQGGGSSSSSGVGEGGEGEGGEESGEGSGEMSGEGSGIGVHPLQIEQKLLSAGGVFREAKWLNAHIPKLTNFRLVCSHKKRLKSLLGLLGELGELFDDLGKDDALYDTLVGTHQRLEEVWETQTLQDVDLFMPAVRSLFDRFEKSEIHLSYLDALCESGELIAWLIGNKNTDDFNRLISITKSNTDDAIALNAIASLLSTRNVLSQLLYPDHPFPSLDAFMSVILELKIGSASEINQIKTASENFDLLLKLFAQKTCSPGLQACYALQEFMHKGEYLWRAETDGVERVRRQDRKSEMVLLTEAKKMSMDELRDLRNRLILAEIPVELEGDVPQLIAKFVDQLTMVLALHKALESLWRAGHFDFQKHEERFPSSTGVEVLEKRVEQLKRDLSEWVQIVHHARSSFYFLNFFSMTEIIYLLDFLESSSPSSENGSDLLLYVCVEMDAEEREKSLAQWKPSSEKSPAERLASLGRWLDKLFSERPPVSRVVASPLVSGGCRLVFDKDVRGPYVAVPPEGRVVDTVLSLYLQQGRLPEPDEVLFCNSSTTLEEVELMIWRWRSAQKHGRGDRLFCVVNCEKLSYTLQSQAVALVLSTDRLLCSTLIFVSGKAEGQHLLSALSGRRLEISPLEDLTLQKIYREISGKFSFDTRVFLSGLPGAGKTFEIHSRVAGAGMCYRHVPIDSKISSDSLISLLGQRNNTGLPCAYHLDIGPDSQSDLNDLLFQLVVVGLLHDPHTSCVYRRAQADAYYIEVSCTFQDQLRKKITLSTALPHTIAEVGEHTLSLNTYEPYSVDVGGGKTQFLSYNSIPNYELQFVCKYLKAFSEGTFKDFEEMTPDYHPDEHPGLTAKECFNILMMYYRSSPEEGGKKKKIDRGHQIIAPSFILLSNFVNYMYQQFFAVSFFPLLTNVACHALDAPGLKQWVIKFLIETSYDFSTRSVKKSDQVQGGALPPPPPGEGGSSSSSPPVVAAPVNIQEAEMRYYIESFEEMRRWDDSAHPFIFFNHAGVDLSGILPSGLGIISLNPGLLNQTMDQNMKGILKHNGFDLDLDYTKITREVALCLLGTILGFDPDFLYQSEYVLTIDNIMKILAIQLRVRYGIPVLIMGETGCGKTALVSFMCGMIQANLMVLNVHGGIKEQDIINFMNEATQRALLEPGKDIYVFFDEINTCDSVSLFKNIVCDGFLKGERIPKNVKFIAAANPYRMKTKENTAEEAGLSFASHGTPGSSSSPKQASSSSTSPATTNQIDPLASLVYRVHPLPETALEYVWDFGTLHPSVESLYIRAMLEKGLKNIPESYQRHGNNFFQMFTDLISHSHRFIRDLKGTVSLRDVARVVKLFNWFQSDFEKRKGVVCREKEKKQQSSNTYKYWSVYYGRYVTYSYPTWTYSKPSEEVVDVLKKSVILSLAHCYHSRLMDEREEFRDSVTDLCNRLSPHDISMKKGEFKKVLMEEQEFYVNEMHPEEGIALNEALCENIFMILVCILNCIPIFVVGKPGTSKSLSLELIASNLNGKTSKSPFFQDFPAVEIFSYQCSPLSTSEGIEQTFTHAKRYQENTSNTRVVVLLDEVGLAEQSPHLPLKVLHKLLEKPEVAVVGLSNWALDLAKMNRSIQLSRPQPSVEDLKSTAMGICSLGEQSQSSVSVHMEYALHALAEAYHHIYKTQKKKDFFGLRDFYSIIKFLHRGMASGEVGDMNGLNDSLLKYAVLRNFGGFPSQMESILKEFFDRLGLRERSGMYEFEEEGVLGLVKGNLTDHFARHLMLLTRNDAALQILLSREMLNYSNTHVIFGSDFPADKTDLNICLNIQTIKNCMADGQTVVLIHSENLYESLYDMLNQHYTVYQGQRFVRLALGKHSRLCPVHDDFRVIVVVDCEDAFNRLAPPLLNRFEKQVLARRDLLNEQQSAILEKLHAAVHSYIHPPGSSFPPCHPWEVFVGFNEDFLSSLVLSVCEKKKKETKNKNKEIDIEEEGREREEDENSLSASVQGEDDSDAILWSCLDRLLWIATPESVVRASAQSSTTNQTSTVNWKQLYFQQQVHSSLVELLDYSSSRPDQFCPDAIGFQMMVMTFSPVSDHVDSILQTSFPGRFSSVRGLKLHEFTSAAEFTDEVKGFFKVGARVKEEEKDKDTEGDEKGKGKEAEEPKGKEKEGEEPKGKEKEGESEESPLKASEGEEGEEGEGFLEEEVLIIQCDPVATSGKRIKHAQYIFEKERASYAMEMEKRGGKLPRKHAILLVHLTRNSLHKVSYDFELNWANVVVDGVRSSSSSSPEKKPGEDGSGARDGAEALNEMTSLPPTMELLEGSQVELLKKIKLRPILQSRFRMCLARLTYPTEQSTGDIQRQIERMGQMLADPRNSLLLEKRLYQLIEDAMELGGEGAGGSGNWQLDVACSAREISLSSSFREALFQRLAGTTCNVFTQLLCRIDRNFNFAVYFDAQKGSTPQKLWMHIFQNPNIFDVNVVLNSSDRYPVHNDGKGGPFRAKFPFSFLFVPAINSMQPEARQISGALSKATQSLLSSAFPFLDEGSEFLDSNLLQAYVHDLLCMMAPITTLTEDVRLKIVYHILTHQMEGEPTNLGVIHAAFWSVEKHLRHLFSLLELVDAPKVVEGLIEGGEGGKWSPECLPGLYARFLGEFMDHLTPSPDVLKDGARLERWGQVVVPARSSMSYLLDWINRCGSAEVEEKARILSQRWSSILFFHLFVRDVYFAGKHVQDVLLTIASLTVFKRDCTISSLSSFDDVTGYLSDVVADFSSSSSPNKIASISLFTHRYINDFLLQDIGSLETSLIETLILIAVGGHSWIGSAEVWEHATTTLKRKKKGAIVISPALQSFIFSEMIQFVLRNVGQVGEKKVLLEKGPLSGVFSSTGLDAAYFAFNCLNDSLKSFSGRLIFEHPAHLLVLKCLDNIFESFGVLSSLLSQLSFSYLGDEKLSVLERLSCFSLIRLLLSKATGEALSSLKTDPSGKGLDKQSPFIIAVNEVLSTKTREEGEGKMLGALRLFFLKEFYRTEGTQFAQQVFGLEGMVEAFPWLSTWKQSDPRVDHFLRKQHLVPFDPFTRVPTNYPESRNAIRTAVDGDVSAISQYFEENNTAIQRAAVLYAVFQEVGALYTTGKEVESGVAKSVEQLRGVMDSSLPPVESPVFRAFTLPSLSSSPPPAPTYLSFNNDMTPVKMLQLGCITRSAGVALASHPNSLMSFFYSALLKPVELKDIFLPSMPSDTRLALMEIMGGGWYECPNGHAYYVDQCGRPTEKLKCATCGEEIGGLDHDLLDTNKQIKKVDRSMPGYILSLLKMGEDQEQYTERSLSAVSLRAFRFLLHSCLLIHSRSFPQGSENLLSLFKSSQNSSDIPPDFSVEKYLHAHLLTDWKVLSALLGKSDEEVALFIHFVCSSLEKIVIKKEREGSRVLGGPLGSVAGRVTWEGYFEKEVVSPIVQGFPGLLSAFHTEYEEDNTSLLAHMRETLDIEKFTPAERNLSLLPALRRFAHPSLQHMRNALNLSKLKGRGEEFPILRLFLSEEQKLRALKFLPDVLKWVDLLSLRFDRRIDREASRIKTVGQVMDDLSADERRQWEPVFQNFATAWNVGWQFVDRYTCMEIPKEFKKVRMTLETPICFCLPDERDEGICPLSFIQNLIATQNQFLDRLYRIIFVPKGENESEKPLSTHFKLHVSSRLRRRHTLEKGSAASSPSPSPSSPPQPQTSPDSTFPSVPSPFTPISQAEEENLFTRLFGRRSSKSKVSKAELEERERREEQQRREEKERELREQEKESEKGKEKDRERRKHRKERRSKSKKKRDYLDFVDESFYENVESISAQNAKYFEMENYVDMRVPTHLLTSEHLISFDPESQLPILLQIYTEFTLEYGLGEELSYNFGAIEQYLMDKVLLGKPFVDLELRKFSFANEARMTGALSAIKQRITQIELGPSVKEHIQKELAESPQYLHACMQALEVVVGFLSSMGGVHVRSFPTQLFLTDYMKQTLFIESSPIYSTKTVSKYVQLQHILSLWKILDDSLEVDPFSNVMSAYKKEIEEEQKIDLKAAAPFLDLSTLLPAMKEFMLNYLGESSTLGPDYFLKDVLSPYTDSQGKELGEFEWYDEHFPQDNLFLRHIHAAYEHLSQYSK